MTGPVTNVTGDPRAQVSLGYFNRECAVLPHFAVLSLDVDNKRVGEKANT